MMIVSVRIHQPVTYLHGVAEDFVETETVEEIPQFSGSSDESETETIAYATTEGT